MDSGALPRTGVRIGKRIVIITLSLIKVMRSVHLRLDPIGYTLRGVNGAIAQGVVASEVLLIFRHAICQLELHAMFRYTTYNFHAKHCANINRTSACRCAVYSVFWLLLRWLPWSDLFRLMEVGTWRSWIVGRLLVHGEAMGLGLCQQ